MTTPTPVYTIDVAGVHRSAFEVGGDGMMGLFTGLHFAYKTSETGCYERNQSGIARDHGTRPLGELFVVFEFESELCVCQYTIR